MKMNAEYDATVDALYIEVRKAEIKESDELMPGVIVDIGFDDQIVGLEILEASRIAGHLIAEDQASATAVNA